jgi:GNAT superfamily N-acetyltransferase
MGARRSPPEKDVIVKFRRVVFRRVNAHDDADFFAWFDVFERAELERDHGRHEGWLPQELRARALDEAAPTVHQLYALLDEDVVVASAVLEVTRDDNLAWICGDLFVDPLKRRRGYGSIALKHLEATASHLGRSTLVSWVVEDGPETGRGPNRTFAPRHGYEVFEENIIREIDWPRPEGELDRLATSWAPNAADYEIVTWRQAAPDSLVAGLAELKAVMPVEVPDSGIGREEERWDNHRYRLHEQRVDDMGRDLLVAAARHRASGDVVGLSELTVSRERPGTAYQWDTLVLRVHRGHSLGALLKIATMRLLEDGQYQTEKIVTSNNSVNSAMIAVNESLGYYPTGGIVGWRKDLNPEQH